MKRFLIGILLLLIFILLSLLAFKNFQKRYAIPGSSAKVTFEGILDPIPINDSLYSIVVNGRVIGVSSDHVGLKKYLGKKIKITGQYSGTTIYADKIEESP